MDDSEESINIQFLFRQSVTVPQTQSQPSQPHLKQSTQWTNKLGSLVDEESVNTTASVPESRLSSSLNYDSSLTTLSAPSVETALRLEGPYFTPANPSSYKTVVCLVAGTGLSGAIAIAAAFAADQRPASKDARECPTTAATRTMAAERVGRWQRCIIVWSVREDDYTDIPFFDRKLLI